ncbi:uncharacterized protein METZ01_LOCUS200047, partial [marine metagenome]
MRPVFHKIEQVNTTTAILIFTSIKNSRSIQTISPSIWELKIATCRSFGQNPPTRLTMSSPPP